MTNALKLERPTNSAMEIETKIQELLERMTLEEKIGQMNQQDVTGDAISDDMRTTVRDGRIGSVINQSNLDVGNELQRIAREESRLGIPLLAARDVIHGFKTVFPIPLGQAASWNPDVVRDGARVAALEARQNGINWTFAPMIDISRDPRWGRIAESLGEDPHLTAELGVAMVEGFQGEDLADPGSIAACAKHFAGYGASECGRDYNTTNIPMNELRNIYLPPFQAAANAGVATFMSSFGDIDGVPATANDFLMRQVLREEWQFDGLTVSDWDSVRQLSVHGITANDRDSAYQAARAGIDMEMAGTAYLDHLANLVRDGLVEEQNIDAMVANILRLKFRLGLFENPYTDADAYPGYATPSALESAKQAATESAVLLKNDNYTLPLDAGTLKNIAVIGPMADVPYEQLGTWIFDGDPDLSVTPLQAIRDQFGDQIDVHFAPALECTRSREWSRLSAAIEAAQKSDVALLFVGEESILSGEAHSRADINLPGAQANLIRLIKQTGTPVVVIIMAGRPLTLENIIHDADAILYAWHPGTMAGPALRNLLFGISVPSGKLPVSFPKAVGQIPMYYNHKNTGRPPEPDSVIHIDDIEIGARQTSLGMTAFHLDAGYKPLYPFGYGLSYTEFVYANLKIDKNVIRIGDTLRASAKLTNTGTRQATEVVQLYVRDLVGSVTRPVKELKGFQRVTLTPGESKTVSFDLPCDALAFHRRDKSFGVEAGEFHLWIGGSSDEGLMSTFRLVTD